jgi:replicative DNA helicase
MKEPIDKQSEYNVLAGMMNSEECVYDAISMIDVDAFTDDLTIKLFKKMSESDKLFTARMLEKDAETQKEKALIRTIDGAYVDNDHFQHDLTKLKNVYLKRQLYFTMNKALSRISVAETNASDIIGTLENELSNLTIEDSNEDIIDPAERAIEGYRLFLEKLQNPDKFKGIPFSIKEGNKVIGFPSLDEALNGAQGGDLIMLAARTGEGKTSLAVNIARMFSLKMEYTGYYQNTEMKIDQMESRFFSPIARVDSKEILSGELKGNTSEISAKNSGISKAYDLYGKSTLILSRIPSLPLHKAKGLSKRVKNKYGKLDYIIVDYVGRMDLSDKERNMQFWDVMYEIVKQLKELAMQLNVPIFILAQRNQAGEVEGAKKMMNECDAVLYFEPISSDDHEILEQTYLNPEKRRKVNFKIVKKKVRRDDSPHPIWCNFDKQKQYINEVPLF